MEWGIPPLTSQRTLSPKGEHRAGPWFWLAYLARSQYAMCARRMQHFEEHPLDAEGTCELHTVTYILSGAELLKNKPQIIWGLGAAPWCLGGTCDSRRCHTLPLCWSLLSICILKAEFETWTSIPGNKGCHFDTQLLHSEMLMSRRTTRFSCSGSRCLFFFLL